MPDGATTATADLSARIAGIGDNQGPSYADLLREELLTAQPAERGALIESVLAMLVTVAVTEPQDVKDARKQVDEAIKAWATREDRKVITDDDVAGRAANLIASITGALKVLEANRKAAKGPFDNAGKLVQAHFQGIAGPLETGKTDVLGKIGVYQKELERKRREAEEQALREAAEAEREREEAARKLREAEEKAAREEQQRLAAQQSPGALIIGQSEAEREREEAERQQREADLAEARRRQAEADRRAEEARQDAARRAAAAAAPVRVTSAHGAMVTSRKTIGYRVIDLTRVPRHLLMLNDAAVKAHTKAAPKNQLPTPVEGIEFFWNEAPVATGR